MDHDAQATRLEQAWSLFRLGRDSEAENIAIRVIQAEPNNPHAHLLLGGIYLDNGKTLLAIERLQTALSIDPTLYHGHIFYSFALLQGNKTKQALEEMQHAIELQPMRPEAYKGLAQIKFDQHDEVFNKVKSFVTKALATKKAPMLDEALLAIDKAIELDPNDSDYYAFKAQILSEYLRDSNDHNNAVALAQHSLTLDPGNSSALTILGSLAASTGDMDAASDYFVHAAQANPQNKLSGVHTIIAERTAIFYGIFSAIGFLLYSHSKIAAVVAALTPFVLHTFFERKIQQEFSSNVQNILETEQKMYSRRVHPLVIPIAAVIFAAIFIVASFFWQKNTTDNNEPVETDCYSFALNEFAIHTNNFASCTTEVRLNTSETTTITLEPHFEKLDLKTIGLVAEDYETKKLDREDLEATEYRHKTAPERSKAIVIDVRGTNLQSDNQDIAFISISTRFPGSTMAKEIDQIVQSFSLTSP